MRACHSAYTMVKIYSLRVSKEIDRQKQIRNEPMSIIPSPFMLTVYGLLLAI
jgi:hypothetical protein